MCYLKHKLPIIFRDKISHAYHKSDCSRVRSGFCNGKECFVVSYLFCRFFLTQRVLTLQETHKYFLVDEYVAATQRNKRHLLLFFASRLVHEQRGFRHRNPNYSYYFNHLYRLFFPFYFYTYKKECSIFF